MKLDYEEYSKISIHNHFGNNSGNGGKQADRILNDKINKKSNFNWDTSIKKVKDAYYSNFNLLAFTNSNIMMPLEYVKLRKLCKTLDMELLFGVEINIKADKQDKYLHVTVVFSTNTRFYDIDGKGIVEKLEEVYKSNNNFYLTVEQLNKWIFGQRAILIPHGIKQSKTSRSASKNVEQFQEIIGLENAFPILIDDNKKYHMETLKKEIRTLLNKADFEWLSSSVNISNADREDCSSIQDPTYIWGKNTFDDLYFAAISEVTKRNRIKRSSDILKKVNYISKILIKPNNIKSQMLECTINCSHGLNTIIGKSRKWKNLIAK